MPFRKGHKRIGNNPGSKGHHWKLSEETKLQISKSQKGKPRFYIRGKKHPNWKGGRKKRNGYIYIYKPKYLMADKQGYVAEHRLVMEKHLGRYLHPKEVVHHINEIVNDNRLENLQLFKNNGEHISYHCLKKPKLPLLQNS